LENGEVDLTSDEDTLDKKETNGNNTSENKENLDSKTVCETIDSPLQHSNQTQSASNPVPSFDNTEVNRMNLPSVVPGSWGGGLEGREGKEKGGIRFPY
jgi:hypothetical protein